MFIVKVLYCNDTKMIAEQVFFLRLMGAACPESPLRLHFFWWWGGGCAARRALCLVVIAVLLTVKDSIKCINVGVGGGFAL